MCYGEVLLEGHVEDVCRQSISCSRQPKKANSGREIYINTMRKWGSLTLRGYICDIYPGRGS